MVGKGIHGKNLQEHNYSTICNYVNIMHVHLGCTNVKRKLTIHIPANHLKIFSWHGANFPGFSRFFPDA